MDRLLEKFNSSFHAQSSWKDGANFALSTTSKFGAASKTTTLSVILGCLCVGIYVKLQRCKSRKRSMPYPFTRSKSLAELYGGDLTLQRLVDYNEARANSETLDETEILLKALLLETHLDLKKLQSTVAKLEMSGREDKAVKILRDSIKYHSHAKKPLPHEVYEIEMLLVEVLIYKGAYKEALECKCLKHEEIADARRPLYKAILYIILGRPGDEAKKCWEEFIDIRREFVEYKSPSSRPERDHEDITNFNVFQEKVMRLKRTIDQAVAPAGRKQTPKE